MHDYNTNVVIAVVIVKMRISMTRRVTVRTMMINYTNHDNKNDKHNNNEKKT